MGEGPRIFISTHIGIQFLINSSWNNTLSNEKCHTRWVNHKIQNFLYTFCRLPKQVFLLIIWGEDMDFPHSTSDNNNLYRLYKICCHGEYKWQQTTNCMELTDLDSHFRLGGLSFISEYLRIIIMQRLRPILTQNNRNKQTWLKRDPPQEENLKFLAPVASIALTESLAGDLKLLLWEFLLEPENY